MPMDISKFRKLVAIDDSDALSRFALGQALFQQDDTPEAVKNDPVVIEAYLGDTEDRSGTGEHVTEVTKQ